MSKPTSSSGKGSKSSGSGGGAMEPDVPHYEPILPAHGSSADHEEHGEGNWLVSYADMMTLLVGFFVILLSFSVMDPEMFDEARKSVTMEFGGTFQVPYKELADRIRDVTKKMGVGDQFLIREGDSGIEISSRGTVFFDLGSADLKPEAMRILQSFLNAVRSEIKDFDIVIEGHTDDIPIAQGAEFRNNWELSSLRACRVLEVFLAEKLDPTRLTALGFADSRPLVPNRDKNGVAIPENQMQNRRVLIKLIAHADQVIPKANPTEPATDAIETPAESSQSETASN